MLSSRPGLHLYYCTSVQETRSRVRNAFIFYFILEYPFITTKLKKSKMSVDTSALSVACQQYLKKLATGVSSCLIHHFEKEFHTISADPERRRHRFRHFQQMLKDVRRAGEIGYKSTMEHMEERMPWMKNCVKAIYVTSVKLMSCVRSKNKDCAIELTIPPVSELLYPCVVQCARVLYYNPKIFSEEIDHDRARVMRRELQQTIHEYIEDELNKHLPIDELLTQYLDDLEDAEDEYQDQDNEDNQENGDYDEDNAGDVDEVDGNGEFNEETNHGGEDGEDGGDEFHDDDDAMEHAGDDMNDDETGEETRQFSLNRDHVPASSVPNLVSQSVQQTVPGSVMETPFDSVQPSAQATQAPAATAPTAPAAPALAPTSTTVTPAMPTSLNNGQNWLR